VTEPCEQKENIAKLFDCHTTAKEKLHDMELRQITIQGDVTHIKTRIDNGMSHTIAEMHQWLAELKPQIKHHADIVQRVEDFGWWISKSVGVVVLACVIGIAVWAIANGWTPKL
jgi:hypothetical protein